MAVPVTEPYLLSPATRVWLAYTGMTTAVAVGSAYAVGIVIRTSIETGIVCFAICLVWTAVTPRVVRWLGRRLR
jgi:hypothetical protein